VVPIAHHNHFYATEVRQEQPKEFFRFLAQEASPQLGSGEPTVLDIGCAGGDFLNYLRTLFPNIRPTAMDVSPELISKASTLLSDCDFVVGDIYRGTGLPERQYDVVFMSGVNYLFDDYEAWLRNIISLTRGSAYIFGVFNPEDLDVRATVQRAGDQTSSMPFNLISQKSINVFLDSLGVRHHFKNWNLPIANPRSHDDPIRSWTIETSTGSFLVVNGMQIVHTFAVLAIDTIKSE